MKEKLNLAPEKGVSIQALLDAGIENLCSVELRSKTMTAVKILVRISIDRLRELCNAERQKQLITLVPITCR